MKKFLGFLEKWFFFWGGGETKKEKVTPSWGVFLSFFLSFSLSLRSYALLFNCGTMGVMRDVMTTPPTLFFDDDDV